MLRKNGHLLAWVVQGLLLVLSLVVMGCPIVTFAAPIIDNSGEVPDAAAKASTLANTLNGYSSGIVTVSGITVTVAQDFKVGPTTAKVAADLTVPDFDVPAGVTFSIPAGKTVTVLAKGKITSSAGSTIYVAGSLIVESDGSVTVNGTLTKAEGSTVSGNIIVSGAGSGDGAVPTLTKVPVVSYSTSGAVSVEFTFNTAVTVTSPSTGVSYSEDKKTVTVTPTGTTPGTLVQVDLTVKDASSGSTETTTVTKKVMPVSGVFSAPTSGEGTVAYYDSNGVVGLKHGGTTTWSFVPSAQADWRKLFNAIYTPNAPDSTEDVIEPGKTTVTYTKAVSDKALGLFKINFSTGKVEIKGDDLPTGGTPASPIVIDIGLPGTVDNPGLPTFYIPDRGLGAADGNGNYAGIRFRVNKGASLVILANNENYIESNSATKSCPTGYFNGGTIEVMAGGKLRDGAFEGFPLGTNAVLLNRNGSYLAVGPELGSDDADDVGDAYKYYTGWLIGPQSATPRIVWDNSAGYIEVRLGRLAITANVTVKKSLGLIYSVWFVGAPTVTIDAAGDSLTIHGKTGLFANGKTGGEYKFYGTTGAKIVIKPGSTLHEAFLTGATGLGEFITAESPNNKVITNAGTGTQVPYTTGTSGISGFPDWGPW